ncbi:15285_t:CDS:2, partial [Acaulospora morrowiae]
YAEYYASLYQDKANGSSMVEDDEFEEVEIEGGEDDAPNGGDEYNDDQDEFMAGDDLEEVDINAQNGHVYSDDDEFDAVDLEESMRSNKRTRKDLLEGYGNSNGNHYW